MPAHARELHIPRDATCACTECSAHRLGYALWMARQQGEITHDDYLAGFELLTILVTDPQRRGEPDGPVQ